MEKTNIRLTIDDRTNYDLTILIAEIGKSGTRITKQELIESALIRLSTMTPEDVRLFVCTGDGVPISRSQKEN